MPCLLARRGQQCPCMCVCVFMLKLCSHSCFALRARVRLCVHIGLGAAYLGVTCGTPELCCGCGAGLGWRVQKVSRFDFWS